MVDSDSNESVLNTDDIALEALMDEAAFKTYMGFWLARPPAERTIAEMVAAANRGDWNALRLAVGTGDLIVTSETEAAVYELRAIARSLARIMRTSPEPTSVACRASLDGKSLALEVAVDTLQGSRYEVALTGSVSGPVGRFFNLYIDAGTESPVQALLASLRIRPAALPAA